MWCSCVWRARASGYRSGGAIVCTEPRVVCEARSEGFPTIESRCSWASLRVVAQTLRSANQVNQAGAASIKEFSQSRSLHQSVSLIGRNTASPGCRKDPLPAEEGCVTGANGRAGSERQAPREWGLAFWSRLAVLCHHTAEMASPNGLPLRQAAGAGEGKKRRL